MVIGLVAFEGGKQRSVISNQKAEENPKTHVPKNGTWGTPAIP
jgi:hypothetical protein